MCIYIYIHVCVCVFLICSANTDIANTQQTLGRPPVPLTPANPGLPEVDFRLLGSADLIQVQGARQATFPEGQRWHSMLALKKPTIYRDLNLNIYIYRERERKSI